MATRPPRKPVATIWSSSRMEYVSTAASGEVSEKIHRLHADGSSIRQIASRLGISYSAVWRVVRDKKSYPSTTREGRRAVSRTKPAEELSADGR